MKTKLVRIFRGNGRSFIILKASEIENVDSVDVRLDTNGYCIPCCWLWSNCSIKNEYIFYLMAPLFETGILSFTISQSLKNGETNSSNLKINTHLLKYRSKINHLLHASVCKDAADFYHGHNFDKVSYSYEIIKTKEFCNLHVDVSEKLLDSTTPQHTSVQLFDEQGTPIEAKTMLIGSQTDNLPNHHFATVIQTFSLSIKEPVRTVCICATKENGELANDFFYIEERGFKKELEIAEHRSTGEWPYKKNFDDHTGSDDNVLTMNTLSSQMSVLIPCCENTLGEDSLAKTLASLIDVALPNNTYLILPENIAVNLSEYRTMPLTEKPEAAALADCINEVTTDFFLIAYPGQIIDAEVLESFPLTDRNCFYFDHLVEQEDEETFPVFKPDLNRHLLFSYNYIENSVVFKTNAAQDYLQFVKTKTTVDDLLYDLLLRVTENGDAVQHVSKPLIHSPLSLHQSSSSHILSDYYRDAGINAKVRLGYEGTLETEYLLEASPKISILIPNKDQSVMLATCIDSILQKLSYSNYEIVVIENNSVEQETFEYYRSVEEQFPGRVRIITFSKPFNFSQIINFGVEQTNGEYLLLLNNDMELISNDLLQTFLGAAMQTDVGVVGGLLLYPDNTVQHAGVILASTGPAHVFRKLSVDAPGYMKRLHCAQEYPAVTGACQLFSRKTFNTVGGYDERFEVAYNDVDFCMKVRAAGLKVLYLPQAQMYHFESASRGLDLSAAKRMRSVMELSLFNFKWPDYQVFGDPFINTNCQQNNLYFKN